MCNKMSSIILNSTRHSVVTNDNISASTDGKFMNYRGTNYTEMRTAVDAPEINRGQFTAGDRVTAKLLVRVFFLGKLTVISLCPPCTTVVPNVHIKLPLYIISIWCVCPGLYLRRQQVAHFERVTNFFFVIWHCFFFLWTGYFYNESRKKKSPDNIITHNPVKMFEQILFKR